MRPSPDIEPLKPPGRVAVIGAGAFGRFSIEAYLATHDLEVMAAVDPAPAARAALPPGIPAFNDWNMVLADPSIEALHLATPPFVRRDLALAALAAGKSLFCEKPLALTLGEADAMIAAADAAGVALGVNYVMRHQPAYQALYRLHDSGIMGTLRTVSFSNFAQAVPPEHWFWDVSKSGGILVEHGVHFFDAYGVICGAASRVAGSFPRRESVDVVVEYAAGPIGRHYHEFAFRQEVELASGTVFYDCGHVRIDGWIPTVMTGAVIAPAEEVSSALASWVAIVQSQDEVTRFSTVFGDRQASYAASITAGMRDVIRRHRDPLYQMLVEATDARESLRVALAGQAAAVSGRPQEL